MKFSHIGPKASIFVLTVGVLICSAVAGNATEKWDAKASARVNLRRNPSSNGAILSIVPKGHKVRIMEKKGLWCKVDVEGEIHGKGWVYAEYLEEILPKAPETESASETVRVEIASEEPKQGIHPAGPPPKVVTEGKKEIFLNTPFPGRVSRTDATVQSSVRPEFQDLDNGSRALSQAEISAAKEPAHISPPQAPPQVRTQDEKPKPLPTPPPEKASRDGVTEQPSIRNEFWSVKDKSIAVSKGDVPMAGEPAHMPTIQPPQSGIESDTAEAVEKASSEVPIQADIFPHFKKLPGKKEEPGTAEQRKPLSVKERTVSISPAVEENAMQRQAVSYERKRPIYKQGSIGLVELTLKLLVIALSCLVILFLHRANKIATNHYDALMQFQHKLNTRQQR